MGMTGASPATGIAWGEAEDILDVVVVVVVARGFGSDLDAVDDIVRR